MYRKLAVLFVFVVGVFIGVATASVAGTIPGLGQKPIAAHPEMPIVAGEPAPGPLTLSNESLALRVSGKHHGRVVGTLVAKIDGRWVEVTFAPQTSFAAR